MTPITVAIRHRFERLQLDVELRLGDGLTALLGPSGAGKTSILNVIAGLLRADEARIVIGGETLADTAHGVWVAPHARRIGYVFQESRLFPHLSVRQNLAYGRWFAAPGPDGVALEEVTRLFDLDALLHRSPATLSGGERRRVALGRALLSRPRLLLLDEPLGSVDVDRRQEILPYLDRLIADLRLPMIYVTHDHDEVETRAELVVNIEHGKARPGTPGRPRTVPLLP
jgi:molybdate transport system ATP-binding protein